ncbi:unnamed protein product [Ectocarpus sp. 6 AP-2014]
MYSRTTGYSSVYRTDPTLVCMYSSTTGETAVVTAVQEETASSFVSTLLLFICSSSTVDSSSCRTDPTLVYMYSSTTETASSMYRTRCAWCVCVLRFFRVQERREDAACSAVTQK